MAFHLNSESIQLRFTNYVKAVGQIYANVLWETAVVPMCRAF